MKLPRMTAAVEHVIWQPRWRDKAVLIAKNKVGQHNIIAFKDIPAGNRWHGQWYVDGRTIQKYEPELMKTRQGSEIAVHPVPLDELVVFEGRE